jgi:hypothetical protein
MSLVPTGVLHPHSSCDREVHRDCRRGGRPTWEDKQGGAQAHEPLLVVGYPPPDSAASHLLAYKAHSKPRPGLGPIPAVAKGGGM